MPTAKFNEGDTIRPNVSWSETFSAKVVKVGECHKKDKKGNTVFDTFCYMVVDSIGNLHYFLENELV